MAPFRVHTIRFYEPEPKAIHTMAFSRDNKLLALSRSDSSLEIWDVQHLPVFLKFIPPLNDVQIECISWYKNRLFSAGLHGFIYEYDLQRLDVKNKCAVTSGPAWCMSVSYANNQIAVGTEEGFVNIFNILPDSLEFHRILDKQEGRIMCVAWHPKGHYIVTGSTDTIRVWATNTGHPVARMTTGRMERKKETIVWSLVMTEDSTIISGDSSGRTSFWNGANGTHVLTVHSHAADVLTVTLNAKGNTAFATGVEPTVMHFQEIRKPDGTRKWVKSLHRKVGDHDIRCLASLKENYVTGGVDSYLTISNFSTKNITRLPPVPRTSVIQMAGQTGLCLLKYRCHVELWKLGESELKTGAIGSNLPLNREPAKIVQLETPHEENLMCSGIDTDGTFIFYSTRKRFRVFEVEWTPGINGKSSTPKGVQKLRFQDKSASLEPPHCAAFFKAKGDSDTYILCGYGVPRIECFAISREGVVVTCWSLEAAALQLTTSIQFISVAGRIAVISDFNSNIVAVDLKSVRLISKLPALSPACITAITVSPDQKNCLVAYSDQKLAQIDIQTAKFTPFTGKFNQCLHPDWKSRQVPVSGASYMKPDLMLLYDCQNLILIDEESEVPEPEEKLHISEANHDDSQDGSLICSSPTYSSSIPPRITGGKEKVRVHPNPNHLIAAVPMDSSTIVCVELTPDQVESKLPPSLRVKKFGAS